MIWGLTWRFSQELRKKNIKKIIFYIGENLKSDPINFSDRVNFQMKPFKMVKIISDNVRWRYVMPTYSADNPKSKICCYNLALPCPSLEGLKKQFLKKAKKKLPQGIEPTTPCMQVCCLNHSATLVGYHERWDFSLRIMPTI